MPKVVYAADGYVDVSTDIGIFVIAYIAYNKTRKRRVSNYINHRRK